MASLLLHLLLLLILWMILESRRPNPPPGGMQVEMISLRRTKVARRLTPKRITPIRGSQEMPFPKAERKVDRRINLPIPDLSFELNVKVEDELQAGDEEWLTMPRKKGKSRTGPIALSRPRRPADIFSPKVKRRGVGEFQGGIGPQGIDVSDMLDTMIEEMIGRNRSGKMDLVFLVDSSGTMRPHILMIARKLSSMAERVKRSKIDLLVGVVSFNRMEREDLIRIFGPTDDISKIRENLISIRCIGDERALNALMTAMEKVKLRRESDRIFVLVTDERMKGGYKVEDVIRAALKNGLSIYILGVKDSQQVKLARETGGDWFEIPTSQEESYIW